MNNIDQNEQFLKDFEQQILENQENMKVIDHVIVLSGKIRSKAFELIEQAKAEERARILDIVDERTQVFSELIAEDENISHTDIYERLRKELNKLKTRIQEATNE